MTSSNGVVGVTGKRVLAVYGHPDDEGQVTGTLAAFVAEGNEVTLLCATRGEVGEISDPLLATPETLGYTRELELRAAMAQIGVLDVRFLGFRDSGMGGTPENDDERCFYQQPPEVAVPAILSVMREVRPHLLFTWGPESGHPDHAAAHRHTLAAYDACGDADEDAAAGDHWTPERLYWGAGSPKRRATIRLEMDRRGLLDESLDEERRKRLDEMMKQPEPAVSVVIDCRRYIDSRRRASSMHRTQFGENGMFARVPEDLAADFFGEERFYQARPVWPEGQALSHDFA